MNPLNEEELQQILRAWQAPTAPAHIEERLFGSTPNTLAPNPRPWAWLLTGAIRIPVPVALLLMLLAAAILYTAPRRQTAIPEAAREIRFSDFRPVAEIQPIVVRRPHASQ